MLLRVKEPRSDSVVSTDSTISHGGSTHIKKCRICFQAEIVPYIPRHKPIKDKSLKRSPPTLYDILKEFISTFIWPPLYSSADEDGFIAPCRCDGSMRWVHRSCLRIWRTSSPRRDSFFKCEQCFTSYKFKRTWLSYFFCHQVTIKALTFVVLTLSLFFSIIAARFVFSSVHNYSEALAADTHVDGRYNTQAEVTEYKPAGGHWETAPIPSKTNSSSGRTEVIVKPTGPPKPTEKSTRTEAGEDPQWEYATVARDYQGMSWGGMALRWLINRPVHIPVPNN